MEKEKTPAKDQPKEHLGFRRIRALMDEISRMKNQPPNSIDYDLVEKKENKLFKLNSVYKKEFGDDILVNFSFDFYNPENVSLNNELTDLTEPVFAAGATSQPHEDFIRQLRVYYENDHKIKIQEPGKKAITWTHGPLGFKNNESKEWKGFLYIIEYPPHIFLLGPSSKTEAGLKIPNREYEKKRKRLFMIDKKLIAFFRREYSLQLPDKFKIYERCREEGREPINLSFKLKMMKKHKKNLHPNMMIIQKINCLTK
ncbi:hypothetical protein ACFL0M_00095 [Thermodesulfobacteriota bacterium]